ncbi:TolC family protein [Helicobacter apodemus]|uniref:TolC family protein n=1 Tax=Helicobacter apodemus TaxID=135569 RepID=A0A4U8UHX2_9HELI|nr:TolC family protein [Helicobacter apodemus]TLE15460.1 TolC family protein [Helicobacter apodemus]
MFYKILLLISLFHFSYALSLQEAIELTLNNNHSIKEQTYFLKEMQYIHQKNQSPFYPSIDANYTTNQSNRLNQRGKKASGSFGGNITYNLFNGLSDIFTLSSSNSLYQAQEHQLQATKEDIILLVKTAYINVLRQNQNVLIAEQSKALLEEQRRESAEFYKVGLIPKNDLLKVEVELKNATQTLLSAKSNLAYFIKTLERYTNTSINPKELIELKLHKPSFKLDTLQNLMYAKNSALLYLDKIIQSKDYLIKSNEGNFLPDINLIGKYTNYSDNYPLIGKNSSYREETSAELQVNLNLFNGFKDKYLLESSKVNKLAFQSQRITLIENLNLQLFESLETYNLALNAYEISLIALKQAEENYRISQNRYKARIESTSNFLDAELLLTKARSNVVLNRYGIIQAIAEIERITQTPQVQE